MTIIVIDDDVREVARLSEVLADAYPSATIMPPRDGKTPKTFLDWNEVVEYVTTASESYVALCLDLALGEGDYHNIVRGLENGVSLRALRPDWVLLAYTRFGGRVKQEPQYRESFDGLIDKNDFNALTTRPQRASYVRRAVEEATLSRTQGRRISYIPSDLKIRDSMGMRLFRAAFGDGAITDIVTNVAGTWSDRALETLTSGHSGAFLLELRGRTSSGAKSVVLKVARSEKVIQDELDAQTKYLEQLGPLTGLLAPLDPEKRTLSDGLGVYYRQARIEGTVLLDLLKRTRWPEARESLRPAVALGAEVCRAGDPRDWPRVTADQLLKLTPVDIGRLQTSASFLGEFAETLKAERLWPAESPSRIAKDISVLADTWEKSAITNLLVRTVVQHGDFNPGNVIIKPNGSPILIDLARLGPWPVGYDIARLALMCRLRLTDAERFMDWLPNRLARWLSESVANIDGDYAESDSVCPEAVYCDQEFKTVLAGLSEEIRGTVAYGYKLCTLWDLLKVMSYHDISVHKRLWAFVEAWRMKGRLERQRAEEDTNHR